MNRRRYAAALCMVALALRAPGAAGTRRADRPLLVPDPVLRALGRQGPATGGMGGDVAASSARRHALALEAAIAAGRHRADAVVVRRLIELAVFIGEADAADADAALERAVELGLHRSDLVVRRRLIDWADPALARSDPPPTPPAGDLAPALLQVFLAAGDDAEAARERALALQRRLNTPAQVEPTADAQVRESETAGNQDIGPWPGDPFPAGRRLPPMSRTRLAATLGEPVADAADQLGADRWHGPFRSRWGWHLVRVAPAA